MRLMALLVKLQPGEAAVCCCALQHVLCILRAAAAGDCWSVDRQISAGWQEAAGAALAACVATLKEVQLLGVHASRCGLLLLPQMMDSVCLYRGVCRMLMCDGSCAICANAC